MKITSVPDKKAKIVTEHKGESMEWDVSILGRLTAGENYDIYEHINAYWAQLSEERQTAIFNVYKDIFNIFEVTYAAPKLQQQLFNPVARLMELHKLDDIKMWSDFTKTIFIPSDLAAVFNDSSENKSTPERTYLRSDYSWLVAMIIALRAMVPVWGAFVDRTEKEIGVNFKEYEAFQLLAFSREVMESIPMQKLKAFTAQNIWPEKEKSSAIWGHVSSEDFPTWILGLVVIRRLSTVDIRGQVDDNHPVKKMFSFVRHRAGTHETSFEGKISNKVFEGTKQDGENNLSVFEGYKNKRELAQGEITPFQYYMRFPQSIALRVCPDLDPTILQESLDSVHAIQHFKIHRPQKRLVQMVLSYNDTMATRSIDHLSVPLMRNAVAITQAVLWHKGFRTLAALVSASADATYTADTLEPLSKQMLEDLVRIYPYVNRPSTKVKSVKQTNAGSIAIDSITDLFSANDWRITLPASWVAKASGNRNTRRISAPRDIRTKLGELSIQLATRSF